MGGPAQIEGVKLRGVLFQWPIIWHFPETGVPGGSAYTDRPWFVAKIDQHGRIVASRLFWRDQTAPQAPRLAALQWARQGTVPGVVTYNKAPSQQNME